MNRTSLSVAPPDLDARQAAPVRTGVSGLHGHLQGPSPPGPTRWTRRSSLFALASMGVPAATAFAGSAVDTRAHMIRVGPGRAVETLAEAARVARDGATIEVDAGTYRRDVAVWTRRDLVLRAVGGRARLVADGAAAEAKAIWVIRSPRMSVEGFDFESAAVPGRNGAGIRLETGSLRVRGCSFIRNEMGLLTGNDPATELVVENSEFAYNQRPDGHNHNLYAGAIGRLSVSGSYFHHAHIGHLLKSRAALNHIAYNRLSDEVDGDASYELEFPNGGIAYVIGNIIQQSASSQNPHMVSFGAEGYRWPANELYLVHNTLVDDLAEPGVFLRVSQGATTVRIVDNLLVGRARWNVGADSDTEFHNNLTLPRAAFGTTAAGAYDPTPVAVGAAHLANAGSANGVSLTPDRQYLHPRRTTPLRAPPSVPGALQPEAPSPR